MAGFNRNGWWNEERIAKAYELFIIDGHSASVVARMMRAQSRSAIIGMAHRQGWVKLLPSEPKSSKAEREPNKRAPRYPMAGVPLKLLIPVARQARAIAKEAAFQPLPGSTPRHLVERGPSQCCWPIGEEFLSCCEPTEDHWYCPEHRALSVNKAQPKHPNQPGILRDSIRIAA